jgi:V8-like Glu-specific endopeptidase
MEAGAKHHSSFLTDASVFGGSSGSPVFILNHFLLLCHRLNLRGDRHRNNLFKARTVVETIEAFLRAHNVDVSASVPRAVSDPSG